MSFPEKMFKYSPDMFCCIDSKGCFVKVSEASKGLIGYHANELEGKPYINFVIPEDRNRTRKTAELVMQGQSAIAFENNYINKNGDVVPIRWTGRWVEEESLMFCCARNATELVKGRQKLEESIQRYVALFDNNPDVVFLENSDGLITDVNKAFCETFKLKKKNVVGQSATSFLPPDMAMVNKRSLEEALSGSILRFDLTCEATEQQPKTFDVVKFPVVANDQVLGVQTIAKDITPIVRSFETISKQAQKLNSIFESITDAFIMLDKDWQITLINSTAENILALDRKTHVGKSLMEVYPPDQFEEFYNHYHYALSTGKSVHFEAFYNEMDVWLEIKAFPSKEGLSIYFDDVTEKIIARQELEKLSLVASKTTNGVIITDKHRRIEWVNDGFTRLSGYQLQEVAGKVPSEFLYSEKTDASNFERVKNDMLKGLPISFDILNSTKYGKDIWLHVQVNPIHDEQGEVVRYITVQTDITERMIAQKELEKLSLVASRTDNGVIITDADGLTIWVNEGFTRMMGYTLGEMQGKKPGDLLQGADTDRQTIRWIGEKLRKGAHFTSKLLNYTKDGRKIWVSIDITPIQNEKGNITQFIAIQRDITFRIEAEEKQLQMTKDLYRQNRDLQQFTYIVSHNLRAPVANAKGLANLLTKSNKESDLFEYALSSLNKSVVQMDNVLHDVNRILSIRDKKDLQETEQVVLQDVFKQAYSLLQEEVLSVGGKVTVELNECHMINTNRAYLYSIFYNLLSNSIKYRSDERQLHIEVKCLKKEEGYHVISFADNGIGFDMERAGEDVFKLYKRFHTNPNTKGRGIGLFLVKTHVEVMGGKIEVRSHVNEGTEFLIYLP